MITYQWYTYLLSFFIITTGSFDGILVSVVVLMVDLSSASCRATCRTLMSVLTLGSLEKTASQYLSHLSESTAFHSSNSNI